MTTSGAPLVSVLVPVRNGADVVRRAIDSALEQESDDIPMEVVVVDDGSTDDTVATLRSLGDARVRIASQPAAGVAVARNHAATLASGTWLALLDSDDVLLPGALAHLFERAGEDVDVVCGGVQRQTTQGQTVELPDRLGPEYHEAVGLFMAGTMLIRRAAWEAVGGQLPGLAHGENGELGLRLVERAHRLGRRIAAVDVPTVRYTQREVVRLDDESRATAARLIATTDHELLARSRSALASYWSISAVYSARAGRTRDAFSAQLAACRANPYDVRQYGRLLVMAVPPLRSRRYRPRVLGEPGT